MKKNKKNDCVELKNKIQQNLYAQYKDLTDADRERRILSKLEASDSPIASFWKQSALKVADKKVEYKKKG